MTNVPVPTAPATLVLAMIQLLLWTTDARKSGGGGFVIVTEEDEDGTSMPVWGIVILVISILSCVACCFCNQSSDSGTAAPVTSKPAGTRIAPARKSVLPAKDSTLPANDPNSVSLLRSVIYKPTKDTKLGITIGDLEQNNGGVIPIVTKVDGLSANTSLKGMRVLVVNGSLCHNTHQTLYLLRQAVGTVTITAGSRNAIAAKVDKMGFSISEYESGALGLQVGSLSPQNASSNLKEGMPILEVNGVYVRDLDKAGIVNAMTKSESGLTVVAVERPPGGLKIALKVENPKGLTPVTAPAQPVVEEISVPSPEATLSGNEKDITADGSAEVAMEEGRSTYEKQRVIDV